MQITAIVSYPQIRQNFGSRTTKRADLHRIESDCFEYTSKSLFPLKEITHKSTEKLFNTDYEPQIPLKKGYYRTFVIDKNTGEYVDLYVAPKIDYIKDSIQVNFDFYRADRPQIEHVGYRTFNVDFKNKIITPGDMETFDKSLRGVGQRGQQLTVQYLLQNGYNNIEILSLTDSYNFHRHSGFKVIDEFADAKETVKSGFIELWQKLLKTDKETVQKMLVYKSADNHSVINLTQSMANFAQYANKNGLKMSEEIVIPMRLTKPALKEWINLSKLKPILR